MKIEEPDEELLELAIEVAESYLEKIGKKLSPKKKAQLVVSLYCLFAEEESRYMKIEEGE